MFYTDLLYKFVIKYANEFVCRVRKINANRTTSILIGLMRLALLMHVYNARLLPRIPRIFRSLTEQSTTMENYRFDWESQPFVRVLCTNAVDLITFFTTLVTRNTSDWPAVVCRNIRLAIELK